MLVGQPSIIVNEIKRVGSNKNGYWQVNIN